MSDHTDKSETGELRPISPIYLDNNATTKVDARVIETMVEALENAWGNPSSLHDFGEAALERIEAARAYVGKLVGARNPSEIVFTSGGTESINTASHLALDPYQSGTVLTGATEHVAVSAPLARYARRGLQILTAAVDGEGRLDVDWIAARISSECRLVTLHAANNETGALLSNDSIRRLSERCREQGVPFHLDAVQIPGKVPLDVSELGVDLLSISAHKFHGPKGVGALYIRSGWSAGAPTAEPGGLVTGGPQESERRGGTQNVPGIVGLGRAAQLALEHVNDTGARAAVRRLRDTLERGLVDRIDGAHVNAAGGDRLDNTASVTLPSVDGDLCLASLAAEGVAVSGGAACSAHRRGPSPVLLAMGLDEVLATRTIRFSLSRLTTASEIERALEVVPRVAEELTALDAPTPG